MHVPAVSVGPALAARLHGRANAARWGVSVADFSVALDTSVRHAFAGQSPTAASVEQHATSLRLDDLALACACAAGHEAAWDHFIREHRPALYRAAEAIDRTGGARELADSLYADLFGLRERAGERQSLFRYFHGRSSLASWVRAVLAQRHIDRIRATRRLDPLPDEDGPAPLAAPASPSVVGARTDCADALQEAMARSVAALAPRDRLRVRCYYVQEMKLAAIGRMLGEHEATVSRQLSRARREIREGVERYLRDVRGYADRAIEECFAAVSADSGSLDLAAMIDAGGPGKNSRQDRS